MNQIHKDALAEAVQLPSGTIHAPYSVRVELSTLGWATPYEPGISSQVTRAGRIAIAEELAA